MAHDTFISDLYRAHEDACRERERRLARQIFLPLLGALLVGALRLWGCPDHDLAELRLRVDGYETVSTWGWEWPACAGVAPLGRATGFSADAPLPYPTATRVRVRGVVCSPVTGPAVVRTLSLEVLP